MTTLNDRSVSSCVPSSIPHYRFDLDGLRGLAIALVVIFHVYVGRVSGGVDVFLLLSGYFFLGSQLRYAAKQKANLNPWWPLWRTIRRLVPALIITLGGTTVLIHYFTPELKSIEFFRQIQASLLYYQNLELTWQNADYAVADATTSALQHLWSMSVQGQFYLCAIVFTTVITLLHRLTHKKLNSTVSGSIIALVSFGSFFYAARYGIWSPPENYYNLLSRLWEFGLGALAAIYANQLFIKNKTIAALLSCIGLIMIMSTGLLILDTAAFPGPLTLLPITGALLVIIGGTTANQISSILSSGSCQFMGTIAYSLYLWHWPLLIIATSYFGDTLSQTVLGTIVIAVSVILAYATYKLIEQPLMQKGHRPSRYESGFREGVANFATTYSAKAASIAGVFITLIGYSLYTQLPQFSARVQAANEINLNDDTHYPGVMAWYGQPATINVAPQPDPSLIGSVYPKAGADGCIVGRNENYDVFRTTGHHGKDCSYGDTSSETVVILAGGSHAEQWLEPLHELGLKHNFKIIPLLRQECPIISGIPGTLSTTCLRWSELAIHKIVELQPAVVISTSTRPSGAHGLGLDTVPEGYAQFWQRLFWNEIPFLGLRDNPWTFNSDGDPFNLSLCLISSSPSESCSIPRDSFYSTYDPAQKYAALYLNMTFVDTADWFCTKESCPAIIGNIVVYRDQNHISNAFAASTAPLIWRHLRPFITTAHTASNMDKY
ncbi:lipopolysaccharide biosynthesis acyltransferase, m [Corynebacterium kutscheri]|uniref:acyltransferase family protein n=1 Tax=Corynebacterium kutscheri TaxID=35755 RepID=UPI000F71639C|nr:acyltransferase family protein [Corynebacterium kutscheri]VEH79897.1 lipopolysaccharide biosynthesis acyltransferase, m [Corynebacterium kutscheri]